MDKYRIDSHKLIYHPRRVSDLIEGKTVYPLYAEISASSKCNHHCTFCAYDYVDEQKIFIDYPVLKRRLGEMGKLGVKSVLYSGEGEPLLHKDILGIVSATKLACIDVAIATNGVLLRPDLSNALLDHLTWIKISINAGTKETYAKVHKTDKNDFDLVLDNLCKMVAAREQKDSKCTIGMQMLLLPENLDEAETLARTASELGIDYLVIKPYSQHLFSKTQKYKDIRYQDHLYLNDQLAKYNSDRFNVIFRIDTMLKWDQSQRNYNRCLALPLWAHIDTSGNVWGCGAFVLDDRFYIGNILEDSFHDLWNSDRRASLTKWAAEELETKDCRVNCRMDKVNEYLWDVKKPSDHVNFI